MSLVLGIFVIFFSQVLACHHGCSGIISDVALDDHNPSEYSIPATENRRTINLPNGMDLDLDLGDLGFGGEDPDEDAVPPIPIEDELEHIHDVDDAVPPHLDNPTSIIGDVALDDHNPSEYSIRATENRRTTNLPNGMGFDLGFGLEPEDPDEDAVPPIPIEDELEHIHDVDDAVPSHLDNPTSIIGEPEDPEDAVPPIPIEDELEHIHDVDDAVPSHLDNPTSIIGELKDFDDKFDDGAVPPDHEYPTSIDEFGDIHVNDAVPPHLDNPTSINNGELKDFGNILHSAEPPLIAEPPFVDDYLKSGNSVLPKFEHPTSNQNELNDVGYMHIDDDVVTTVVAPVVAPELEPEPASIINKLNDIGYMHMDDDDDGGVAPIVVAPELQPEPASIINSAKTKPESRKLLKDISN